MREAYEQAVTIDNARRDNRMFCKLPCDDEAVAKVNLVKSEDGSVVEQPFSAMALSKTACNRCGSSKPHDYKKCRAKDLNCFKCGMKGHLSTVCRNVSGSSNNLANFRNEGSAVVVTSESVYSTEDNYSNLSHAMVLANVQGKSYQTLLDSGSSKCFIRESIAKSLGIKTSRAGFKVGMAQSSNKVPITGSCKVNLMLLGMNYSDVTLYVMKDLCVEILLGRDFLELHKQVTFQFNGYRDELVVSAGRCAVAVAKVETPSLFANLVPGWRPITTKSRRFNQIDKEFIEQTLTKWRLAGTVRPSKSPWRAQCVVVKQNGEAKRLATARQSTYSRKKTDFLFH